jgi:hypothetical protein
LILAELAVVGEATTEPPSSPPPPQPLRTRRQAERKNTCERLMDIRGISQNFEQIRL